MKKLLLIASMLISTTTLMAQKTPLSQADYDGWRRLSKVGVSADGNYFYYVEKPQEGDATLTLKSKDLTRSVSVDCVEELTFVGNRYALFKISPKKELLKTLRRKKTAKEKLPTDSSYLMDLEKMSYNKLEKNISYRQVGELPVLQFTRTIKLPVDTTKKAEVAKDTVKTKPAKDAKKKTQSYKRLVLWNLESGDSITVDSVKGVFVHKNMTFAYTKEIDSVEYLFVKQNEKEYRIFGEKNLQIKTLVFDEDANQIAFTYTLDTAKKNQIYDLAYFDFKNAKKSKYMAEKLELNGSAAMPEDYCVEEAPLAFTTDGKILKFNITPKPKEEVKDTLLDEEKFSLDLWSYTDTLIMSKQLVRKQEMESYAAIWIPKTKQWIQLGNKYIKDVKVPDNTSAMVGYCTTSNPYTINSDWDYPVGTDHYLVDLKTGKRTLLLKDIIGWVNYSPDMSYAVAWNARESQLYSVNLKTKEMQNISDTINFAAPIDTPTYPGVYGNAGWGRDGSFYAYDRFDLWRLDVTGKSAPVCVTRGYGRETNQSLRVYFPFERKGEDKLYVNLEDMTMFRAFNYDTKESGYYRIEKDAEPVKLIGGKYHFAVVACANAKDNDFCMWTRENFNECPELWIGTKQFENAKKVTNLSAQMENRLWGSVELIEWTDFNGKKSTGMLYKPENYDPTRKYPTIVYFYEKSSDQIYRYHMPQPSWSIVVPSVCTSNGYVVFIPDIDYTAGYPGECCYNKVVSGSQALIERGIADPERMGLQGQSWGGYQIAYLVTRTNMFRCASPGAPVSNMTSAYTGIRTTTGMVRMFMYEHGQSRMGASLWEAPMRYIENSPVFYAPKVETPMLIRHDDADEAVPFQQGVDLFMCLKRCGKTVWMLNYNKEPHNLRSRAARMDWDKRMMQFFDYYLKDAKMPRWMQEGISAKEKNKDRKYELVD